MNELNNLTEDTTEVDIDKGCRESFVFYRSFQEAINELSGSDQLLVYRSIANYALDREDPNLKGVSKVVWLLVKPQLDANWRKYEKGCRGGAPKGNTNAVKTTKKQPKNNLKQANVNDNDNVNDNVNVNDVEITTIPILSEILTFISENRLDVDAHYFYDYYSSNGWMMGKNPMVDWRAALRNWSRNTEQSINPLQTTLSDDL